jgi:hypothetical protein
VPPYLVAVVEDAWENSWNSLPICSAVMPVPVCRECDPVPAVLLFLVGSNSHGALFGELVGVAHEVQQRLPQPHLVGMQHPDRSVAMDRDLKADQTPTPVAIRNEPIFTNELILRIRTTATVCAVRLFTETSYLAD